MALAEGVIIAYLGFHVWTAGLGAEGREVTQRLGLLLETHDAVLLEHDEAGWDVLVPASLSSCGCLLSHPDSQSQERFMT